VAAADSRRLWFREVVRDVHGIDLAEGFAPPQPMLDYRRGQS
jgi:hypothetical protein